MRDLKVNDNGFVQMTGLTVPVVKGVVIALLLIIIISLFPAVLIKSSIISTTGLKVISIAILFVAGFIGAIVSSISYGKNGMIIGIVTNLAILAIVFLMGLLFQTVSFEMIDLSVFLIKLFGLMLFGAIGGILGINIKH